MVQRKQPHPACFTSDVSPNASAVRGIRPKASGSQTRVEHIRSNPHDLPKKKQEKNLGIFIITVINH